MVVVLISVIGTLASLGGIYAIIDNRRNRRVKALAYESIGPAPLATASSHEQDYQLTIHYRPGGADEDEVIEAAYVTYLRFANFGKEPIRSADIAPANPLRVQIEGVRVLDISLAGTRRDVTRVAVGEPELAETESHATVGFDFLDQYDGGLIRILSTGRDGASIKLVGDIIGMPAGVTRSDEPIRAKDRWGKIGVGLFFFLQTAAIALAAYVIKLVTGDWKDLWLFLVPVAAVFGPGMLALFISETIWPSRARSGQYPQELAMPRWLQRSVALRTAPYPAFDEVSPDLEIAGAVTQEISARSVDTKGTRARASQ